MSKSKLMCGHLHCRRGDGYLIVNIYIDSSLNVIGIGILYLIGVTCGTCGTWKTHNINIVFFLL